MKTHLVFLLPFLWLLSSCGNTCKENSEDEKCMAKNPLKNKVDIMVSLDSLSQDTSYIVFRGLSEFNNRLKYTGKNQVKMAFVESRAVGPTRYKPEFLGTPEGTTYQSYEMNSVFNSMSKKVEKHGLPFGIFEMAIRANPSFVREEARPLFVIFSETDEKSPSYDSYRVLVNSKPFRMLIFTPASTNELNSFSGRHYDLSKQTRESITRELWSELYALGK